MLGKHGGVWSALTAEREQHFARFTAQYLTVRHNEGRGSEDPAYYLALPYRDLTDRLADQWTMRGKTYRYFEGRILSGFEKTSPQGLDILDLGAGNGWLCYRLALRGQRPVAIDLLDDPLDGLGAARHYSGALPGEFPRLRAEYDNLPFADAQFDLAVFNASFHYSTDYAKTLQEVRRCLRQPGQVVILDTPIYRDWKHGELMREDRHRDFESRYGFRSDSVPSMEYLHKDMLARLSKELNINWEIHRPWYGWQWHSRPFKAFLTGRRPPSRFWILAGSWGPR